MYHIWLIYFWFSDAGLRGGGREMDGIGENLAFVPGVDEILFNG